MSETKTCPRCGTKIGADQGPGGLCAACLMKMGFDSRSGVASVVFTESDAAPRAPAPAIADLAAHFPELEIRELVAQGGMGCVYRARQKSLERDVALKILTVGTDDPSFAGRFEREARTLAGLSHPGIVSVFEFGQRGPWSFLVMEFVEGASLRQMMRAKTVGARESLSIVTQMCDALQFAHDKGVVHRDIKPENVLVTRDGRVRVLDFGLAKLVRGPQMTNLTQAHQVMGTPHYMAPEQWERPASVDHRADIYALGVVFYELLTGELPMGRFAPPSHKVAIDVRLDEVVLRSLEREPDRRYQHASQMKDTVTGIASTPAPSPAQPARRTPLVQKIALGCLGGAVLGIVAATSFLVLYGGKMASIPPSTVVVGGSGSSVQHVERDAPSAYVESGMKDLQLESALSDRIGLSRQAADEVNIALAPIWQKYLNLELRIVSGTWQPPDGWLHLRVLAAREDRNELLELADRTIAHALEIGGDQDRWIRSLQDKLARSMRFGDSSEQLDIFVDEAMSRSQSAELSDNTQAYPPDRAFARTWNRMLPSRPPQRK